VTRSLLAALPLLGGCLNLDSFVYNGIPCSQVSAATCEDLDSVWDQVCATCDEPYDWGREYPWEPGTLAEGETVTPIDPAIVQQQSIATDDGLGTLDLYVIPSVGGDPDLADTTILYQHGNYAGIEPYVARLQFLHDAGYNVIVWDYRGYGKSLPEDSPTSEQFLADARQIRALADDLAPDPARIVTYGYSLGGVPTVEMAATDPGCATFLEAPFTSLEAIATSNSGATMGEQFFSEGRFDNIAKIAGYEGPLLLMVGTKDNKFPVADIQKFYDAAPGPKQLWTVEGMYHGVGKGVPEGGLQAYLDTMKTFLAEKAPGCLATPVGG